MVPSTNNFNTDAKTDNDTNTSDYVIEILFQKQCLIYLQLFIYEAAKRSFQYRQDQGSSQRF
jgi:hypothetical protein